MIKQIKIGSDFSGVGAFDFAMQRVAKAKKFDVRNVFACDMDKYARLSYLANHPAPENYPKNVYDREIPSESLDVYMTSPPCQSFSLAGNRKGEDDGRGLLFYNSHEFIKKNKPRFFIFENVRGLLSDADGGTFRKWETLLGGKSVNGSMNIFPHEESVPYHIYHKVLNSKDYGVPQNRERIFIIGIRDDEDNDFSFPREQHLTRSMKDLLEEEIDEKYFLGQQRINTIQQKERAIGFTDVEKKKVANCVMCHYSKNPTDGEYLKVKSKDLILAGNLQGEKWERQHESSRRFYDPEGVSPTIPTGAGGNHHPKVVVHQIQEIVSVRKYPVYIESLQLCLKNHRILTVKEIASKLDISKTTVEHWFRTDKHFAIPDAEYWMQLKELLKIETDEFDKSIMTFEERLGKYDQSNRVYDENGLAPTLTSAKAESKIMTYDNAESQLIRRLTPRECFRLQDFDDSFKFVVSDSQLYKQAGNSITIAVLEALLLKMNL